MMMMMMITKTVRRGSVLAGWLLTGQDRPERQVSRALLAEPTLLFFELSGGRLWPQWREPSSSLTLAPVMTCEGAGPGASLAVDGGQERCNMGVGVGMGVDQTREDIAGQLGEGFWGGGDLFVAIEICGCTMGLQGGGEGMWVIIMVAKG